MENNCAIGEGLSYEDKLHVVCSVMGISSTVLLQRVVDRYYNMLVKHAGTFEDAVPSVAGRKSGAPPDTSITSLAPKAKISANVGAETTPASLTDEPSHTTPAVNVPSPAPVLASTPTADTPLPVLANGTSPAEKAKRTRRWSSLPTEELDKMIVEALQKRGTCNLRELTIVTGYTSTNRLLQRAFALEKQGMLEVVKEGRGYLIDIANRQLQ